MKKWALRVIIALVVILVGIQLVPVTRDNPPVTAPIQWPAEMDAVARRACFDCHSNETDWPWYSKVAPMSWVVTHHVHEGRGEMNFSEWASYPQKRQAKLARDAWEEVNEGEMPLSEYVQAHAEARLTDADKAVIRAWSESIAGPSGEGNEGRGDHDDDAH